VRLAEAFELPRLAITGPPKHGKNYLAERIAGARPIVDTDEIDRELRAQGVPDAERWTLVSAMAVERCRALESFVAVGCRVAHALRKGLEADAVLWCDVPRDGYDAERHRSMTVSVTKAFRDWRLANDLRAEPVPVFIP
jgi:hypothetical protein